MNFWKNKTVVVTGGSDGLGREIALAFARQAADVVVLARDNEKLNLLCQEGRQAHPPLSLTGIRADVTSDESLQAAIDSAVERFGHIDVWVNNVGKSTRVAFQACGVELYREMMEINFYSAVRCALAALPYLQSTDGHLVNIGSLASRTGWPLIAPYATSKHALSAFHHQLRLEGPPNIHYLEVCPGPLKRSDSGGRYASQTAGLDKAAGEPGGGVRLSGISPAWLASRIEKACRQRKVELFVPRYARMLFSLAQICPRWTDRILLRMRKKD